MSISPCPPPSAPSRGVVVFVPADFKVAFPEFTTVLDAALQRNFTRATLQLNNTCRSMVCDAAVRELLLDLLTAHITALTNGVNGEPPAGVVGRVSDATQGSVSVSAEYASNTSAMLAYYSQTKYGAEFWTSTAQYRSALYVPPPNNGCAPFYGFPPGWPGGNGCG